jgi:predicted N-acetyltransferase YhbS
MMNYEESKLTFRKALKSDADGIFRVLASAFELEEGTLKWQNMRGAAYGGTESFLVLYKNDEIIGTVMISSHWLRVGSARVLKGDVGEVAILRDLHGKGFGTLMMQECIRYLQENGFHLSRLGGLNRFYAKFGYVPFPRRYYEFLLTGVHAGASVFTPEQMVTLSPEEEKLIRFYHPQKDWQKRNELYDSFNENRSGSMIEWHGSPPTSGVPDPNALRFVYEEDGNVEGYLFASEYPYEPSPFEAKVTIYDIAFNINKPKALATLMRYNLRESVKRGAQRVTARLPFDPLVQKTLTDGVIYYSLQELQSAIASNMMLVLDLQEILKTISSELTRRIVNAPYFKPFSVQISINEQTATLAIDKASVSVVDIESPNANVTCDMTAFLRWLFGLNGFSEWQVGTNHSLNNEQAQIFSMIFPQQPCASGVWG